MNTSKTRRRFLSLLGIGVVFAGIGIGIWAVTKSSTNIGFDKLRGRQRFATLERLAGRLHIGMTEAEVAERLGKPDNSDTNYVWFWTSSESVPTNEIVWVDHFSDDDGRYLLFYNDKLISPLLKNTEATPWEYFKTATGASDTEVARVLGLKPKIVVP